MRLLRVATCNLNQWAMDFDTNLCNVKESIKRAKAAGATVRVGPELELTGYGCEDHFLEQDTTAHAYVTYLSRSTLTWESRIAACSLPIVIVRVKLLRSTVLLFLP
jgi:predicted amidohydrolase